MKPPTAWASLAVGEQAIRYLEGRHYLPRIDLTMHWIRLGLLALLLPVAFREAYGGGESPLPPGEEVGTFVLDDPGLEVQLVASEPDVRSPVALAWDASQRLYVAEMIGYPETPGLGRITRLEDRDRDGRYEHVQVFAGGFDFPASVMAVEAGVLVADAPHIWLLRDTNEDGEADERQIVWTGFRPGSQQLRANALHWGPDNWIHGANGRNDGEVTRPEGGGAISIRSRDFRFRLQPAAFEAVVGQSQFGQVHDDWGRRFLSWNTIPVRQQLLPGWFLEACPDLASLAIVDVAEPGDSGEIFPLSPPPRQFNAERASFYNALCGLTILHSPFLGSDYEGNAFVGESLSNLVIRRKLDATGVVARTQRPNPKSDFLASSDSWFHPVFLATGPDGALYLCDFYRPLVEHPIYVASEQARREVDWRQGAEHGRIWRVSRRGERQTRQPPVPPADLSSSELVARLEHPVGWQRDTARRVLVERRQHGLAGDVRRVWSSAATAQGRLQAMWTLEGLGELKVADLQRALSDESDLVRCQGIALSGSLLPQDETLRQTCRNLAGQGSSLIRFQLALSSVKWQDEERGELLKSLIHLAPGESPLTEVVLAVAARTPGQMLDVVGQLVRDEPQAWLSPDEGRSRFLRGVGRRLGVDPLDEHDAEGLENLLQLARDRSESAGVGWILAGMSESGVPLGKSLKAALAWKDPALVDWARRMVQEKLDSDIKPADPAMWAAPLGLFVWGEPDATLRDLMRLVKRGQPAEVQSLAAFVIGEVATPSSVEELLGVWTEAGTPARRELLRGAARSLALGQMVLEGWREGMISPADFPADILVTLVQSDSVDLRGLAREVAPAVNTDRQQVVDAHQEALSHRGNALAGARVFRQHCLVCHQVQREGGAVGPDLSGIGGRPREAVLVDLLDPNRRVNPNFVVQLVELKSGVVASGLIMAETAQTLVLKRADGSTEQIPVAGIVEVRSTGQSLMPEGFEQKLPGTSLVDLLEFLGNPSRDLLRQAGREESREE